MASLLSNTQWHGNPRPIKSNTSSVYIEHVPSPYYKDGRDVPVIRYFNTTEPLPDLTPTATIDVAGPATAVSFTVGGVWDELTSLTILLTIADTVAGDYSATLVARELTGPVAVAADVAADIDLHPELTATSDGETVNITVDAPGTAVTITTLTVN